MRANDDRQDVVVLPLKKETTSIISRFTIYVIDPRDDKWWPSCGYNTAWRSPSGHLWAILSSCLEFCVTIVGWMYSLVLVSDTIQVCQFLFVEKPGFANLWYWCIACAQRYLNQAQASHLAYVTKSRCNQEILLIPSFIERSRTGAHRQSRRHSWSW